jgi:hypothetical protein
LGFNPQHTPLIVTGSPLSAVIVPPYIAEFDVILSTVKLDVMVAKFCFFSGSGSGVGLQLNKLTIKPKRLSILNELNFIG